MKLKNAVLKLVRLIGDPIENHCPVFLNMMLNMCFAALGSFYFAKIKRRYPNHKYLITYTRSAGDIMYLKIMLDRILNENNIEKYVFILDDATGLKAAKGYGISNLYPASALKQHSLLIYLNLTFTPECDAIYVHKWEMFDYKKSLKYSPIYPQTECDYKIIDEFFDKKELVPGKTIIISPYEQTITAYKLVRLNFLFWEELACELTKRGYIVCTNCTGSDEEPVIPGTKRAFPKFNEINALCEKAGSVIATRSGFADFVYTSQAKKIVLYPSKDFFNGYSFTRICDFDNGIEIIYDEYVDDYSRLIDKILEQFPNITEVQNVGV